MSTLPTTKRKIIEIDEATCTGCGDCIPNCPEGALRIIDGKARLVGDLRCDGLGACVGHCPTGAMKVIEREAEPYDERLVMESIVRQGPETIRAHLDHLEEHNETLFHRQALDYLAEHEIPVPEKKESGDERHARGGGCPGGAAMDLSAMRRALPLAGNQAMAGARRPSPAPRPSEGEGSRTFGGLQSWPVQLSLVPVNAPYLSGADVLIAADCTAFAAGGFHEKLAEGKVVLIGCPKLDDAQHYAAKLARMFAENDVRSVTVAHMVVPCCRGMLSLVHHAVQASGKDIEVRPVMIGLDGQMDA